MLLKVVKDYLAEYFKKFNTKAGFNYEELDTIIFRLVDTVNSKLGNANPTVCSKFLSQIIILVHFVFITCLNDAFLKRFKILALYKQPVYSIRRGKNKTPRRIGQQTV